MSSHYSTSGREDHGARYAAFQPGHVRRRSSTTAPSSTTLLLPPIKPPAAPPNLPRLGTPVQHRRAVIRTALLGALAFVTLVTVLLLPQRWAAVPSDQTVQAVNPPTATQAPLQEEATIPSNRPPPHQAAKIQYEALPDSTESLQATASSLPHSAKVRPPKLPICEKTAVFRFAGLHGFGSEVTLMYRVAAVAAHFGYEVFLDDTRWNYGAWSDYFSPLSLPSFVSGRITSLQDKPRCRLPKEGTKRAKIVLSADELRALSGSSGTDLSFTPRWTTRPHVLWSSRDMDGLDLTYLHLFTNSSDLGYLRRADLEMAAADPPLFLSPEQTLPPVYERAFSQSSRIADRAWQLDEDLLQAVGEMQSAIGVSGALQRSETAGTSVRPEDVMIAVHVRLGDKFLEIDRVKAALDMAASTEHTTTPGLTDELVTAYFAAAIDSVHSLCGLSPAGHAEPDIFEPRWNTRSGDDELEGGGAMATSTGKPLLVLMSDDTTAVDVFRRYPLARWFQIKSTSEVASTAAASNDESAGEMPEGKRAPARLSRRGHDGPIPAGFNETKFNRLPLAARVESTRVFVRDLTFLARTADALVVTSSSNVGRLLMLLFEAHGKGSKRRNEDAGIDPSERIGADGAAREQSRREMRSLDTRWFPTARYT